MPQRSLYDWLMSEAIPHPPCGGLTRLKGRNDAGYVLLRGKRAHRIVWEHEHGPIAVGLKVLHRCDEPPCFDIRHLFLGTTADNSLDMVTKGRSNRGAARPLAVLTEEAVRDIRATTYRGSGIVLAERYGVSRSLISMVRKRQRWAWLPE